MSSVRFLADHDLNDHIVEGVRRREPAVAFLRVRDQGMQAELDAVILEFAHREHLIVVSHDVNTTTLAAAKRLEESKGISGLMLVPQSAAVASIIESLILIWSTTELEDWADQIVFLPL